MAGVFGEAMPPDLYQRYLRLRLALYTGWTPSQMDGLSLPDWFDLVALLNGMAQVQHLGARSG